MRITYIHHSSFFVELDSICLLFDYTEGKLPELKREKPLLVFASHRHGDHFSKKIFDLKDQKENIRYVLSDDIWRKRLPQEMLESVDSMKPDCARHYEVRDGFIFPSRDKASGGIEVTTFRSTDEGVAFLVRTEGKTIYHAGDLNNWRWEGEPDSWNDAMARNYSAEVLKLKRVPVDIAFLPLDPRQEENFYLGFDEFMRKAEVKAAFPMHCWGDFSVIGKLKELEASSPYRDRIVTIVRDGECFTME